MRNQNSSMNRLSPTRSGRKFYPFDHLVGGRSRGGERGDGKGEGKEKAERGRGRKMRERGGSGEGKGEAGDQRKGGQRRTATPGADCVIKRDCTKQMTMNFYQSKGILAKFTFDIMANISSAAYDFTNL